MPNATFDEVLDAIEQLSTDEQMELLEVVRRRIAERGRRRVIDEVAQAESDFDKGLAKSTNVDDLIREIES